MKLAPLSLAMTSILLATPALANTPYVDTLELAVQPVVEKPAVGETFIGEDFGATITRLTDSGTRASIYDGGQYVKGDYSRVQSENADGSRLMVLAVNDNSLMQYALANMDGSNITLIDLPNDNAAEIDIMHDETEARWHPSNPAVIRFIQGQNSYVGGLKVYEYNWQTQEVTVLADLTGKLPAKWGNELYGMTHLEGEYSADGNRLAWSIENNKESAVGYVTFDLREGGVVLGTKDYDGREHNNLSISPSGRYIAISGTESTAYFPVDFSSEHLIGAEAQHGDFCVTAEGNDCYITVSFDDQQDADWGWVFSVDLETGERTPLLDVWALGNTSMHFSGRGHDAQGWALMSTYNCHMGDPLVTATNLCSRNMLVELKENPKVYTLNWNHATGETYYSEPHATMSRDAKHVYYASDWMNKTGSVDLYRLDIDPETFAGIAPYVPPANPLPPAAVTLLSPADNSTVDADLPVLFSFEPRASDNAEVNYDLQLVNSKSGDVLENYSEVPAADICLPASCDVQLDVGTLQPNSQYTWQVKANTESASSSWSSRSLKTESTDAVKPARPTALAPVNKTTIDINAALVFEWQAPTVSNAASDLTHFVLQVIDSTDKGTVIEFEVPASNCVEQVCRFEPGDALNLAEAKKHVWKVQAVNTAGESPVAKAKFSLSDLSRVKPALPELLTPAANSVVSANEVLTLTWQAPQAPNASSATTQYDLVLFDRSLKSKVVDLRNLEAASLCDASGLCSYTSETTSVSAHKKHTWRVRARNSKGKSKWASAKFKAE